MPALYPRGYPVALKYSYREWYPTSPLAFRSAYTGSLIPRLRTSYYTYRTPSLWYGTHVPISGIRRKEMSIPISVPLRLSWWSSVPSRSELRLKSSLDSSVSSIDSDYYLPTRRTYRSPLVRSSYVSYRYPLKQYRRSYISPYLSSQR